jgi:hypothetical protein
MIERTVDELRAIALDADDAAGYFPALYVGVTRRIAEGIRDQRFENGERMERLIVVFAGYYTRARAEQTPIARCWQATWDVADDPNLLIAQHLLLGMNAHINHDLPQAVVDVADEHGGLLAMRTDFDSVNDILAATFVDVTRDLDAVSKWANEAAMLGGRHLFNFSMRRARSQAWRASELLHERDTAQREEYVRDLDRLVSVLAYLITRPVLPMNLVVWLARRFEQHDPRLVTQRLLGTA